MTLKEIFTSSIAKLGGEKRPRVIAEFLAIKVRGLMADAHLLPGDHKGFVRWVQKQPKSMQIVLKQVFDGIAAVSHALPDGQSVTQLFVGEIASELLAQTGYVMTHADKEQVAEALPIVRNKLVEDPKVKSIVSKILGSIEDWEKAFDQDHENITQSRETLKQQHTAWKARGFRRFF